MHRSQQKTVSSCECVRTHGTWRSALVTIVVGKWLFSNNLSEVLWSDARGQLWTSLLWLPGNTFAGIQCVHIVEGSVNPLRVTSGAGAETWACFSIHIMQCCIVSVVYV